MEPTSRVRFDRIRNGVAWTLAALAAVVAIRAVLTRVAPDLLTGDWAEPDPMRGVRTTTALLALHVLLRVDRREKVEERFRDRLLAGATGGLAGLTGVAFAVALAWPRVHGGVTAERLPLAALAGAVGGLLLTATVVQAIVIGARRLGLLSAPGGGRRLAFVLAAGLGAWAALELDPSKEWALPRDATPWTAFGLGCSAFATLSAIQAVVLVRTARWRVAAVVIPLAAVSLTIFATAPAPLPAGEIEAGMPRVVLLVTIDTTRADHVHAYGYERETTPRIDALAEEAVLFEHAISPMPTTDCTHTAILTGLHPRSTGVMANGYPVTRPGGVTTLADWFQDRGYRTGAITSRVLLDPVTLNWGTGFQTFSAPARTTKPAHLTLPRALSWIDRHGDAAFFLWVHFWDPHGPYDPPREPERSMFVDRYRGEFHKRSGPRRKPYSPEEIEYATGLYDGEIHYADDHAGRLIDAVRERYGRENVLIVLLSDHGEVMAEFEEEYGWSFAHSAQLVPETLRVPLLISWPGRLPQGRRVSVPVSTVSVTPTLTDLLGAELVADEPSLVPLLTTDGPAPAPAFSERQLYLDPPRHRPWLGLPELAVTHENHILVENKSRGRFLYDLRTLGASEAPDILDRLSRLIVQFRTRPRVEPSTEDWSAGKRNALRGLTYIR